MFGLALVGLALAYSVLFGSGNVPAVIHSGSSFLCSWYLITGGIGLMIFIVGILSSFLLAITTDGDESKGYAKTMGYLIALVFGNTFRVVLYYVASLLLYRASVIDPNNWSQWDSNKLISAGVIGGLALVWQMFASVSSSKS